MFRLTNLNVVSTIKNAGLSEKASAKHSPFIQEIGNWVGILRRIKMVSYNLEYVNTVIYAILTFARLAVNKTHS